MEPQQKGSRSYDVRINTAILRDPARLRMGSAANMALTNLQAYALEADRDGIVYANEYTKDDPYPGIPWVNDETLSELKRTDLAEDYEDERGQGIRVTWRWQSTVEERTNSRKSDAARQQARRDRQREEREELDRLREERSQWVQSSQGTQTVTSASRVTNGGVGKERKGQERKGEGEVRKTDREESRSAQFGNYDLPNFPPPPPKALPLNLRS